MNNVNLIGRLTRDPELKYIPGTGTAVANFTLAVDRGLSKDKKKEMEQQGKATADFIRTVVWGKQAENCANYLAKGRLVAISGSIRTSSSRDESGNVSYYTDVNAFKVEFLEWGDKKNDSSNSGYDNDINPNNFSSVEDDDDIPF
ncbi:single-stranded DNA-binding protein [Clostridiaceae bacterium HSG29]|nr:single-stranded DNA-binding protein [Clostridiaceae bacterium HSG29]